MPTKDTSKRRIFIEKQGSNFQLFSFNQHKDGSIYASMPEFPNVKWMTIVRQDDNLGLAIVDPLTDEGKLSIHGTGMTTYRAHSESNKHRLIVKGNFLMDAGQRKAGVRHLFTSFFQEPAYLPETSPAMNRETDYLLKSSKEIKPFVMTFFAVPAVRKISVNVNASFHVDDLESVPPESGFGCFNLRFHSVVWFYYRTKHMERWPANTHICYYDGYKVPIFIGTGLGEVRLEIRHPSYTITDAGLTISIPMADGVADV